MKKNKIIITILIIFLAVGFAAISTTLVLGGVVGIAFNKSDFNVIFTDAELDNIKRLDFISDDKKEINFETRVLTTYDDESILEYEVTNKSKNYDAEVSFNVNIPEDENVIVDYQPKTMTLQAGESKKGKITIRLIKVVTEERNIVVRFSMKSNAMRKNSAYQGQVNSQGGTLMAANFDEEKGTTTGAFWDYKENITKVVFENQMIPHETSDDLIFDVSENQDGSVIAYLVQTTLSDEEINAQLEALIHSNTGMTIKEYKQYVIENYGVSEEEFNQELEYMKTEYVLVTSYTLYLQSNGNIIANEDSSSLFADFQVLRIIDNLDILDTSKVTNMSSMFSRCISLIELDLSNFDTSKVTDMSRMFSGDQDNTSDSLISLNLSGFDTHNVTSMYSMFFGRINLKDLDLSSFDTINVVSMHNMFYQCSNLTYLDLSNFDTSNVTTMKSMFRECRELVELDLSNFDTSNVTDMSEMFSDCGNLTELDLDSFNTSNVTDMSYMFSDCRNLTELDLSNYDTSNVANMKFIFSDCSNLKILNISNFDFSKLKKSDCYCVFRGMVDDAKIIVKDVTAQKFILGLSLSDRPSAWTTSNVIIAS